MPKNNFIKISDINAAMSYSLGFNSKRECLQFIKEHKIETSKKSFDEFENSILKVQNKIPLCPDMFVQLFKMTVTFEPIH